MVKFNTVGLNYATLRKECLEAARQWPGCESIAGIQILRHNRRGGFSVRISTLGHRLATRKMSLSDDTGA
jgi:hypothetical protein